MPDSDGRLRGQRLGRTAPLNWYRTYLEGGGLQTTLALATNRVARKSKSKISRARYESSGHPPLLRAANRRLRCQCVELRAANMVEPNSDAAGEFVVTNLNFGNFTEQTLCGAIENVRGSLVVDFYSPKGVGPARAQTVMLVIMSELLALTTRPACLTSMGCWEH